MKSGINIQLPHAKLIYTVTPQFSEIGPIKLTENYELCSKWADKNTKITRFFRMFRPKIARNVHDLEHRKLRKRKLRGRKLWGRGELKKY